MIMTDAVAMGWGCCAHQKKMSETVSTVQKETLGEDMGGVNKRTGWECTLCWLR